MWERFKEGHASYRTRITKIYERKGIFFKKEIFKGYFIEIEEFEYDNCYGWSQIINDKLYTFDNNLIWHIENASDEIFTACLVSVALEKVRSKNKEYQNKVNEINRTCLIIKEKGE